MKRFRLSTLMLLVVIAAMGIGLIAQGLRHRRGETEQQGRLLNLLKEREAQITGRRFFAGGYGHSSVLFGTSRRRIHERPDL
jgi:hypothetical protein